MATRYLAIILHDTDAKVDISASLLKLCDLTCVHDSSHLRVFIDATDDTITLPQNTGVIVGKLFTRADMPKRVRGFNTREGKRITDSRLVHLLGAYWGGYVAFVCDPVNKNVHLLRDPSGAMPCFILSLAGATLISSDIETLIQSGFLIPEIDWSYLPRHLVAPSLPSAQTGLRGVMEHLSGFRSSFDGHAVHCLQLWSPWDFVARETSLSDADLADNLRHTIQSCVGAWADCFNRPIIGVSGGLDSSIVASALAQHHTAVTCFTLATAEADGDERAFARTLSEAIGCPLLEAYHDLDDIDVFRSAATHLPRPQGVGYGQSMTLPAVRFAEECGSDAIFSGHGGDNVFCFMQSATPLLDRLRVKGLSVGLVTTLNDICQLTGCSIWDAVAMALQKACSGSSGHTWIPDRLFLEKTLVVDRPAPTHPWLDSPRGALPGKAAHIAKLTGTQSYVDSTSRYDKQTYVHPLLSQPIVELCLQIPTWQWCAGGQNRSVARDAFANTLPSLIIARRSKGGPNSFAFDVIDSHRDTLRPFLLEGCLMKHGLLDSRGLTDVFNDRRPMLQAHHMRLSLLTEAEAWVRHWQDQRTAKLASS